MSQFTDEELKARRQARAERADRMRRRSSVPGSYRVEGHVCVICQLARVPIGTATHKRPVCAECISVAKRLREVHGSKSLRHAVEDGARERARRHRHRIFIG